VNEKKGADVARGLRSSCGTTRTRSWWVRSASGDGADRDQSALTGHLVFHDGACEQRVMCLDVFWNMVSSRTTFPFRGPELHPGAAAGCGNGCCGSALRRWHYYTDCAGIEWAGTGGWQGLRFAKGRGASSAAGRGIAGESAIHELLELDDEIPRDGC